MSQKEKILIALASISAVLLLFVLVASRPAEQVPASTKMSEPDRKPEQSSKIDLKVLDENYKSALRSKFKTIDNELSSSHLVPLASSSTSRLEDPIYLESERLKTKIANYKKDVMSMTVPGEWRDLHIKIVFALDKYDSYISNGKTTDRAASLDLLRTAKAKYTWLFD